MERASNVFYDLVLNHNPELLSPQYNAFYDAVKSDEKKQMIEVTTADTAKETHNRITLG
jgi:hypothetical protein